MMNSKKEKEELVDAYDQSQAGVREVIYRTIDKTTFLQAKNKVRRSSVEESCI